MPTNNFISDYEIESGHVWSDLMSRSYSETLSLQLQRCGGTEQRERAFDRCPGIGVARCSLARSIVSSVAKNVRPKNDPRRGRRRTTGGRGTKRKRRPPSLTK